MEYMRNIKPPLPFVGHKGHWVSELSEIASSLPENYTVFDVFGGSGVCAHCFKQARPDLNVVWNDFDNYQARLDHVDQTESLRQRLLDGLGRPVPKGAFKPPMTDEQRDFVFKTLDAHQTQFGFVDEQTVSRWFYLYPLKTHKLRSSTGKMYNRIPVVPLRAAACASWLTDVRRTSVAFSGLDTQFTFPTFCIYPRTFIPSQDALFVFDPPYLATGCNDYGNQDALFCLRNIVECCECLPFLLFGDASIAFWYEALFRGRPVRKYEKQINNVGMAGTRRTEVLFARLPGDA